MKSNLKKMFAITMALGILTFGFPVNSVDSAGTHDKVNLAVALTGCVIVQDDEFGLVYRKKCERCGHVQPGSVMSGHIAKGFRIVQTFRCVKCGAQNKLEIQG